MKILPGTGRGTMRSMVEGGCHNRSAHLGRAPSVALARATCPCRGGSLGLRELMG